MQWVIWLRYVNGGLIAGGAAVAVAMLVAGP
jgi:hypothetical protein